MFNLEKYDLRCAAVTGVAISAAVAGYSIYQGEKKKSEAKKAMNNLDQQALTNVYEDIPISTAGSDYLKEQNSRTTAQLVGATRNAGIRGVLSAVPKIQAMSNDANKEGQVYLDNQVNERNKLIASDNRRIQGMEEQRYNQELAGIGNLMEVGQAYTDQGIRGLGNTLISGARAIEAEKNGGEDNGDYSGLTGKERRLARRAIRENNESDYMIDDSSYYMGRLPEILSPSEMRINQSQRGSLYNNLKPDPYGLG